MILQEERKLVDNNLFIIKPLQHQNVLRRPAL
jgi:hypothetical protein